jgi:hypothetical protein
MYLKVNFEVDMILAGSEFDPDNIEYNSKLSGFSFNRKVWAKEFRLVVNRDNSLRLESEDREINAVCESY